MRTGRWEEGDEDSGMWGEGDMRTGRQRDMGTRTGRYGAGREGQEDMG